MQFLSIALLALVSVANGFLLAPFASRPLVRAPAATMMGVEDAAAACLEEGCSVDTVEDLIQELKKEQSSMDMTVPLSPRQRSIIATMAQLKALGPNADKDALS